MLNKYLFLSIIMSILFSAGIWNDAPLHRNGALLVEVATVTVTVEDDNGARGGYDDAKGRYSAYSGDSVMMGDRMLSIYIYDPASNMLDDVIARYDFLIEGTKETYK